MIEDDASRIIASTAEEREMAESLDLDWELQAASQVRQAQNAARAPGCSGGRVAESEYIDLFIRGVL